MAVRRAMSGRPLLVATTGVTIAVGCAGPVAPVGNLVAPPTTQVCVDTDPAGAAVSIDGNPAAGRCTPVYRFEGETVRVDVSAPGYEPRSEGVPVEADGTVDLRVTLGPAMPPVGNLVAPPPIPPPRPVGNLMPPQPIPPPPAPK